MISRPSVVLTSVVLLLASATAAQAVTHNMALATDVFTPSFRGGSNATWVGWDTFDDNNAGDEIINDSTPDLGAGTGSFVTTNGQDHIAGSLDFYSGFGEVAETVTINTAPGVSGGFTTVFVQAVALQFGPPSAFFTDIAFSDLSGVSPTQVIQDVNATGNGQLWAKYEVPGNPASVSFSLSASAPGGSHIAIDKFVVDTVWSDSGYAPDFAIATPEPSSACLALLGLCGFRVSRRR